MTLCAIIPARGGSKAIPRKNLVDFFGKPLLAWTIENCLRAKQIQSVYVTSDSEEILDVAKKFGATPIKRPEDISGDRASSESALLHAISVMSEKPHAIVFPQVTSPLRKPDDISDAIDLFQKEKYDSLFSAAVLEDFLIWEKNKEGELKSFNYDFRNRGRRQDRVPQYVENGSFYIFKTEILEKSENRLGGKIGMFLMELWQSFEIDEPHDLPMMSNLFETQVFKKFYS